MKPLQDFIVIKQKPKLKYLSFGFCLSPDFIFVEYLYRI